MDDEGYKHVVNTNEEEKQETGRILEDVFLRSIINDLCGHLNYVINPQTAYENYQQKIQPQRWGF